MNLKKFSLVIVVVCLTSMSPNLAAFVPQDNAHDKALLDAVEKGEIEMSRYESYLSMISGEDNRK